MYNRNRKYPLNPRIDTPQILIRVAKQINEKITLVNIFKLREKEKRTWPIALYSEFSFLAPIPWREVMGED